MDSSQAIALLKALAQNTRLAAYRALVGERDGVAAGALARRLGVPQNTLSSHLAILAESGLVDSERQARSIIYRASIKRLEELTLFLARDCCGGNPALCMPFLMHSGSVTQTRDCR